MSPVRKTIFFAADGKEINIFQSADYGKCAEKAGERFEIKIFDICRIGRYYEGGYRRCRHSYGKNRIVFRNAAAFLKSKLFF